MKTWITVLCAAALLAGCAKPRVQDAQYEELSDWRELLDEHGNPAKWGLSWWGRQGNPYNMGADASACITCFTLEDKVKSPTSSANTAARRVKN